MPRASTVALWAPAVLIGSVVVLAFAGVAEPALTASQIPVAPPVAFAGVGALFVGAIVGTGLLDRRAWKRAARGVGLQPTETAILGKPDVSGTVAGRSVRARTYATGSAGQGSNTTYTIVEADLDRPVEWWGMLAEADSDDPPSVEDVDGMDSYTVGGEMTIRGDIPREVGRDLLTPSVRSSLAEVAGAVTIGDMDQQFVALMQSQLGDADAFGGGLAKGLLSMVGGGEPAGPSESVRYQAEGTVYDEEELRRRVDAVVAVADAVDHTSTRTGRESAT